jgi:hypothetical protein
MNISNRLYTLSFLKLLLIVTVLFFLISCSWNSPYLPGTVTGGGGGGQELGWYEDFLEYAANPVFDNGRNYYSCVVYDPANFGDSIGEFVNGAAGDTYQVLPYYKMYVGDGTNTDFGYSADGINWYYPATGQDILSNNGYHSSVIYSATGFPGETKQNPATTYRLWTWASTNNYLTYYESSDGINFTFYPAVQITNTLGIGASTVYSNSILYRPGNNPRYEGWIDNNGRLYYITSNDCITWQRPPGNEITHSGKNGIAPGTSFQTGGWCSVIVYNGRYTMWYSSNVDGVSGVPYNEGISYAESDDGLNWELAEIIPYIGINATPAGAIQNAVLHVNDGTVWRTFRCYNPFVIYDANQFSGNGESRYFKMWFTGQTTSSSSSRSIGYVSFNRKTLM